VRRNLKALSVLVFVFLASFVILSGQKASAAMAFGPQPGLPPPSTAYESGKITGCNIDSAGHTHITGFAETTNPFAGSDATMPVVRIYVWKAPDPSLNLSAIAWAYEMYGKLGLNPSIRRDANAANPITVPATLFTPYAYYPDAGFDYDMASQGEYLTKGDNWLVIAYAFVPLTSAPITNAVPLGVTDGSGFTFAGLPEPCKTDASAPPFGKVKSCSLTNGHLHILGYADDPDASGVDVEPKVTVRIQDITTGVKSPVNYSREVPTDLNASYTSIVVPLIRTGAYGFDWDYSGFAWDDRAYVITAFVSNYPAGKDVPLSFVGAIGMGTFGPYVGLINKTDSPGCVTPRPPKDFGTPPLVNPAADCGVVITCPDNPKLTEAETNTITVPTTTLSTTSTSTVIKLILTLAGGVALIVIFVAGLRFVISQGNPDATVKARNTIVYALIGLVIITLAYNIVTFVLLRL